MGVEYVEKEEGNAKSAEVTELDVISRARYVTEEVFKAGRMKKVEFSKKVRTSRSPNSKIES